MVDGTIKFFNDVKNYGFIEGDDGNDYFVHRSDIVGEASLAEGDRVSFTPVEGDRGPKADKVEKL
ncbi:MAG: DNA-binding protein [Candidatus Altiarchaeales archaeon ex4484_2]|nr:MAG: DNA-binding protein [Candidatus Altiarchaeales archaeon ex4484_2]